jgi:tetratricopeptide (TPR) repeat protein
MRSACAALALLGCLCLASVARADDLDPLGQAIDANPDDTKAYDAFAMAAFKQKRFDEAIKRLKVGVARIPGYGDGYYKLAYAYRQKREWADAADYYRRFIAMNPQKTDPYFGLGAALEGLGDRKGAIAAYEKYVALEHAPAKQGFVDQAKAELAKLDPARGTVPAPVPAAAPAPVPARAAAGATSSAASLRAQADQLRKAGRLEEAADAYQRASDADRGNVDLLNELGNTYFALKRYADAARVFEQTTARDPSYALGWYNQAHALRKADKKDDAVKAYRQYIRLRPEDPDPYYGLGQTLKAIGDVHGAAAAFRQYIGMEKRPDEQKWVDKARTELESLETMEKRATPLAPGSSSSLDVGPETARLMMELASERLDRELQRDNVLPIELYDPFPEQAVSGSGRIRDLKDPFAGAMDDADVAHARVRPSQKRLAEYGMAIAAYRRALARLTEEVTLQYERGVAQALANDPAATQRIWNSVTLADAPLEAARRSVERLRATVAARQ